MSEQSSNLGVQTSGNPLAGPASAIAGAGDAAMARVQQWAEVMGKVLAAQHAQSQNNPTGAPPAAGRVIGGVIPGMPQSAAIPPSAPPTPVPAHIPGQNYWDRGQSSATNVINMIGQATDKVLQHKKEQEFVAAQRDYNILMEAHKMLALNPNDEHSANIINMMLDPSTGEGKKRIQRLQKVFAFDKEDFQAQQKKGQDTDYQAFQSAAKKTTDAQNNMTATAGGAPTSVNRMVGMLPGAQQQGEPVPNLPGVQTSAPVGNNEKPQEMMDKLNPTAQAFFSRAPKQIMAPQYIPSADEVAQNWRVINKVIPDPDKAMEFQGKVIDAQMQGVIAAGKNITDISKESMTSMSKLYGDASRGYFAAMLKDQTDRLELGIKQMGVNLEAGKLNSERLKQTIEQTNQLVNMTGQRVQVYGARLKDMFDFQKTPEFNKLSKEQKLNYTTEIESVRTNYVNAQKQNDTAWQMNQFVSNKVLGIPTPTPDREGDSKNGAAALTDFSRISGATSGGAASGSPATSHGSSSNGSSSFRVGSRINTVTGQPIVPGAE